ncbi:MAG TPA: hypothetical protein PL048_21045 [Leptospiraceae bacterium]|nr:hypothetical protein [Leptospiraceae bacterium]HNI95253.1 hypothetical protein [Leptospiraceae bacterium]HNM02280.1 hypothetical protein [Leptospiraceae bacterium]HNN02099.1 hypothetical protein [Leptospiraceae bacterium]HNO21887.1 hypothetical protein [Leptospiraceae bacterium]
MRDDLFMFFPLLMIPALILVMTYIYFQADRKHPSETGKTPRLSFRCAGIIGWISYKGPFIRVSLYEDFIIISYRKIIMLKFSEISVKKEKFLFNKTLRIEHGNSEYPDKIKLFVSNYAVFLDFLRTKSVKISE